jgi:hypothetical protein
MHLWDSVDPELRNALGTATCNICNKGKTFTIKKLPHFDWADSFPGNLDLRESLVCEECGSSSRDRMYIWALGKCLNEFGPLVNWSVNKNIKILESAGRRRHPQELDLRYEYYNTEYIPEKIKSEPNKYADFQNLHFPDECFDFVISSDVFEHIRLHMHALREVCRVLKNRGRFILQVPYCDIWPKNYVKVRPDGESDIFFTEPEYHAANTLVYRIYGKELHSELKEAGFDVTYICKQIPEFMISLQPIFICSKRHQ